MSAGLSKGLFIILKLAFPRARAGRERISPKVEAQSFYYPLSDASSHHLCCILFSRSKSLIAATFKERELHKCRNTGQRRQWHPTPVLLPGKSHGRRGLVSVVHGVAKSRTRLNDFTLTFHCHALEKEKATHSSVLAWRIPGTGEPGGLPSMGSHRVGHD